MDPKIWSPNVLSSTLVVGIAVLGYDSQQIETSYDLFLNEFNSYRYVTDSSNHRIQLRMHQ
jgi:hypothetical protein